jgi:hypothetical protein
MSRDRLQGDVPVHAIEECNNDKMSVFHIKRI